MSIRMPLATLAHVTAQIPDSIRLEYPGDRDRIRKIQGVRGDALFDPAQRGWITASPSTANWRGYVANYGIHESRLVLRDLDIHFADPNAPIPKLHEHEGRKNGGEVVYNNMRMPIDFTGGILACDRFIRELYVHMGFHPAWKFEHVEELIFDKGKLVQRDDVSAKLAEVREVMIRAPLEPAKREDIAGWVQRCFTLEY